MNRRKSLYIAGWATIFLFATSSAVASQPNSRFAVYSVTVTLPSGQHSVLVNETVRPSDRSGFSDLILQLTGSQHNLTYSRLVNASTNLFPYLPTLALQSFDYSNGTRYSVHVNFSSGGTAVVSFKGSQYTVNVYSIIVSATYGNKSVTANGTVETFPSALVYSASAGSGNKIEVKAVLQATNLPLVQPSSQTATPAYIGAGLGVGGVALVAAFLVRRRERKARTQEQKPLHWVD